MERITLPLLQRMETEKKRAEDKGEKLHPAQAKGSDSEEEETTFEGRGVLGKPIITRGTVSSSF